MMMEVVVLDYWRRPEGQILWKIRHSVLTHYSKESKDRIFLACFIFRQSVSAFYIMYFTIQSLFILIHKIFCTCNGMQWCYSPPPLWLFFYWPSETQ